MRVIAGSRRSLPLRTLEGDATRPTADKYKETLFNCIQADVPNSYVLDLFAGSGAIGIEALSRGARRAVLIDNSRDLGRDGIPIHRAGEDKRVRGEDIVCDRVEVVIERTGLSGLIAGLAGMTEVELQLGSVDHFDFVAFSGGCVSECLCHTIAVAAFSGAACEDKDLL